MFYRGSGITEDSDEPKSSPVIRGAPNPPGMHLNPLRACRDRGAALLLVLPSLLTPPDLHYSRLCCGLSPRCDDGLRGHLDHLGALGEGQAVARAVRKEVWNVV